MNRAVLNRAVLDCAYVGTADVGGVGVMGAFDEGEVQPYIKGHITDGSSTFTFTVNGNESITVPVDSNGEWKWVVDRTITSMVEAFKNKSTLDKCNLYNVKTSGSCQSMFQNCTALVELTLDNSLSDTSTLYGFLSGTNAQKTVVCKGVTFKNVASCWRAFLGCDSVVGLEQATFENNTSCYQMFYNYRGTTLDLRSADFSKSTSMGGMFTIASGSAPLENLNIKKLVLSTAFGAFSNLTEQSVVNLFSAVAADGITLTFHQNVWNMIMREIDVQGSPIQVAYQNMIDNYDVTIANASFDAEIEYLESNGTQRIDTGINYSGNIGIDCEVAFLSEQGTQIALRNVTANEVIGIVYYNHKIICQRVVMSNNGVINITYNNQFHTIKNFPSYCQIDNNSNEVQGQFDVTVTNEIKLYGQTFKEDFYYATLRFKYVKIYDGNTLVRDFIPVRKGTTGYMYDKVSGNLFGNSGTGDFILGNDK